MMKNILLIFVLIPVFSGLFSQDTLDVKSEIDAVTVYKEGAQIKRTASTMIDRGKTTIILKKLSSNLDKNTIRVKANDGITVLSVIHTYDYMNFENSNKEIRKFKEEQDQIIDTIGLYKKFLLVLNDEKSLLQSNRSIGGSQNGVEIENLKATAEFYRERMREIELQILNHNNKIKGLNLRIIKIARQLNELNAKKDFTSSDIIVVLKSERKQKASIDFEYFISEAGWIPYYDIRVTDVDSPVKIFYKAKIYQNTNVDWENVNLTLSTGNPSVSGFKPSLNTYYLTQNNFYRGNSNITDNEYYGYVRGKVTNDEGEFLPGVTVIVEGTNTATITDLNGNYTLNAPYGSKLLYKYIGMNDFEQNVSSSGINVMLSPNSMIEDVVVSALGVSKDEKALGYSVQNFDFDNSYGGSPGSLSNIIMRGFFSINKDNQPLYIVDGIPIDNNSSGSQSINGGTDFGNGVNDINPDDIDDIKVIKGFEATSMYGSRGNNGVVLISTKKGKSKNLIPMNIKKHETNREFIIDVPYTIRSDNKEYDVNMTEFDLPSEYKHYAVPKLSEKVYLTALLTDWQEIGMLNGNANVFFKETYTGKTYLDLETLSDTLSLSLGIDNDVFIKREQVKDFSKTKFLGTNIKESRAWKISVKNLKNYPVEIILEDQIPVAQNNKIRIEDVEKSGAEENEENGMLKWIFKLKPSESKELILKYSVKYPSDLNIIVD